MAAQTISLGDLQTNKSKCVDTFRKVYYEGRSNCTPGLGYDDTLFYVAKIKCIGHIAYKKAQTGSSLDILEYKNRSHFLKIIEEDAETSVDADPDNVPLYQLAIGKRHYYYFSCGGTGLLRSGSFQNIRFYIVFSKNTPPIALMSGTEYKYSFCDLNNDKKLDFIQIRSSDNPSFSYMTKTFTLQDGKFIPLNSKFNNLYIKDIQMIDKIIKL